MNRYAAVLLVDHDINYEGDEITDMIAEAMGILGARYIDQTDTSQFSVAVVFETDEDPRQGLETRMDGVDQSWIEGWDTAPDTTITQIDTLDIEAALDAAEAQLESDGTEGNNLDDREKHERELARAADEDEEEVG